MDVGRFPHESVIYRAIQVHIILLPRNQMRNCCSVSGVVKPVHKTITVVSGLRQWKRSKGSHYSDSSPTRILRCTLPGFCLFVRLFSFAFVFSSFPGWLSTFLCVCKCLEMCFVKCLFILSFPLVSLNCLLPFMLFLCHHADMPISPKASVLEGGSQGMQC